MNNRPASSRLISLSLLLLLILPAKLFAARHPQSPEYWPTDGWRSTTPEEQGFDSVKLAEALDYIRQQDINIHSLLIVRNGYVLLDAYFYPYDEKEVHDTASVTKSVTSTLVGIAIDQGKLRSIGQQVPELFPRRAVANKDELKEKLTVESLLMMSSGLKCQPAQHELTLHQMTESGDWVQFMLDLPMEDEPGRRFVYCSGGMHLLSGVISQTTGASALDFARRSFFEPLGIRDASWPADPQGVNHGWGDLHLRPRDMAKIGYLYLNRGAWDGKQVVSPHWVAEATRVHIKTGGESDYGYGWWVRPRDGLYEAVGRGGQRITVLPEKNIIVVMTGGGFEPSDVGKFIAAAVKSDRPLPENRAGQDRLQAAIRAAALPPTPKPVPGLPATAAKISSKRYVFNDNPLGLRSISLTFRSPSEGVAQLTFSDKRFTNDPAASRPLGLDGVPRVSPGGRYGLPVALKGFWEGEQTFVLDYDEVANINSYRFSMKFDGKKLTLQITERTGAAKFSLKGEMN